VDEIEDGLTFSRSCRECRRLKEKCEGGMPCKRCRHLRRLCDFKPVPAREERRESYPDRSVEELKDRSACMECILRHHFPDMSLDIDALRYTCDRLPLGSVADQSETSVELPETIPSAPASDSPGIEDENCTLDYVDGTTVRTCTLGLELSASRANTMLLLWCRLLWRILALELFHAH
jgi:hypothetical protein